MFQRKAKTTPSKTPEKSVNPVPLIVSSTALLHASCAALSQTVYDVVIVGSGAAGGTAAQVLVEAGLKVAMLEAGAQRKPFVDFAYHDPFPYEAPNRKPENKNDNFQKKYSLTGSTPDEPYTAPKDAPYEWFRARNVGGRTMFWGRFANRFNENDFKMRSRDGAGLDWPIEYKDIAPYYDKAETFMGVCGQAENHPDLPDGIYMGPVALKCPDYILKRAAKNIGIRTIGIRRAMLVKPYRPQHVKFNDMDIPSCHYCAGCDNGCETWSFYNSAFRQVEPLLQKYPKTFTLIPNAMAHKVNVNDKGLASGVSYVDKATGKEVEIKARAVVLGCGTLETTRLLLLSNIANSSGQIGKNFIEHLDVGAQAFLPDLSFFEREEGDGMGGSHIIIPWFGSFRANEKRDFLRGFQIEPSARQRMRPDKNPKNMPGFGANFKKEVRRWQSTRVTLACHGEMLPSANKFVELDNSAKDKWGSPVLKINYKWDDNDLNMFKYISKTYEELFQAAKAVDVTLPKNPDPAGHSIHEMGTVHMGSDPKTSVLNQYNQSWDVKNLFVMDASAFASGTHKNPTLTIMALAWRASEYMLEEMRKKNI